jgi:hypothetical protein
MPSHGDNLVHETLCRTVSPPRSRASAPGLAGQAAIGHHVAAMIEDSSTLQMGINASPTPCSTR